MTTKRDLLRTLKAIKTKPRLLSPAECDELILLLGGTIRPKHRPEVTVFGVNRRRANWTAIASVVFGFLENAERLAQFEAELRELEHSDAKGVAPEHRAAELLYLTSRVDALRPISAKNRAAAERMALDWFKSRGVEIALTRIQNEIDALRQRAGLKRFGLAEWRTLNVKNR